jgi:hypothetical protein
VLGIIAKANVLFSTHNNITIWTVFCLQPLLGIHPLHFLYHSPPSNYLRKLYGKCTEFSGEIYLVFTFSHSDISIFYFTVRKMWQNCNTSYKTKWIITTVLLPTIKMARTWQYALQMARTWQYAPQKQTFSTWYYKTLIKLSLPKPSTYYFYQQINNVLLAKIKLSVNSNIVPLCSINSNTVPLCSITINFKHTYHLPCTR